MATISEKLQTFLLSAEDLRMLNPDWQDQMIEDYLNIFRNLAIIAEESDNQFIIDSGLEQLIFDSQAMISKLQARLNQIDQIPKPVENNGKLRVRLNKHDTELQNIRQLQSAW